MFLTSSFSRVHFLLILTLGSILVSCNQRAKITQEVEKVNASLPLSLGAIGSVSQIVDEDSVIAMTITLNSKVVDFKALAVDSSTLKMAFGRQFYSSEARQLLQKMADESVDFLVRYTNSTHTESKSVRLRARDLLTVARQPLTAVQTQHLHTAKENFSPRNAILGNLLNEERKNIPFKVAEGMTLVAVDTVSSGLVYTTDIDTTLVPITLLQAQRKALHHNILSSIKHTSDPQTQQTYRLCGEYDIALTFNYRLSKGKRLVQIIISPNELRQATGKISE